VGQPLAAVRDILQKDPTLWELLDTPLMLTIVTLAYAGESAEALLTRETPEDRRRHLFAAYVNRMFQRRSAITRYPSQQTERWLAWLAWQLTQHGQTVFYLEQMQAGWLPQQPRLALAVGVGLLAGLGAGLFFGVLVGLFFGPLAGLGAGLGVGLGVGLDSGGSTCFQHVVLRLWLVRNDAAPWRYTDFLDYAAERIFLRKVGGGYSFIHQLLQAYFAVRHSEPDGGAH
jgi:hypothetical protein